MNRGTDQVAVDDLQPARLEGSIEQVASPYSVNALPKFGIMSPENPATCAPSGNSQFYKLTTISLCDSEAGPMADFVYEASDCSWFDALSLSKPFSGAECSSCYF